MKINRKDLQSALKVLAPAINKKSVLPFSQYALLTTKDGQLNLVTTNLEAYVRVSIPSDGEFNSCVLFSDLEKYSKCKGDWIEINGTRAKIGNISLTSNTMDSMEFPPLPEPADLPSLIVDGELLKHALNQVFKAASTDEARPVLTGIHIWHDLQNSKLILETADGCRLHRVSVPTSPINCLLPAKSVKLINKLGDAVTMSLDKEHNNLCFGSGNTFMSFQLIEGTYPNIEQVFPSKINYEISAPKESWLESLEPFKKSDGVLKLLASEGALVLALDDTTVTMPIQLNIINSTKLDTIRFNPNYLIDAINSCGDLVTMGINTPVTACKITSGDFLAVVMPMHIE
jgi:DNA polymerase-3 subunit beta